MFGSRVGFSGSTDLMVQLSNFKNPGWRLAAILDIDSTIRLSLVFYHRGLHTRTAVARITLALAGLSCWICIQPVHVICVVAYIRDFFRQLTTKTDVVGFVYLISSLNLRPLNVMLPDRWCSVIGEKISLTATEIRTAENRDLLPSFTAAERSAENRESAPRTSSRSGRKIRENPTGFVKV